MILLRASVLNFKRLDLLRDIIGHTSKNLSSFEFAQNFCFQFRESRYITGLNRASEKKIIVVWFCSKLLFWISSVSIYYRIHSDIREKRYCRLIKHRASILNFERLDILQDTIGHPSKRLLSFEFAEIFCFQFLASRYITRLNRTSE